MASAARFGDVLAYTCPNLSSSQLIVYAPNGPGGPQPGPGGGPNGQTAPPVSMVQAQKVANEVAADLGTTSMVTLETTSAGLVHAAPGPFWSGQIYLATPSCSGRSGSATARSTPAPTSARCGPACPR